MNLIIAVLIFLLKFGDTRAIFPNAYDVLVKLPFFVDKSEMLKILFDDNETTPQGKPFYYITCPRGFGKTLNLLMVKSFAEIVVDEVGQRKNYTETETYARFKSLKIAKYESVIANHMARYPIIIIDLSEIFNYGITLEDTCLALSTILWYELHNYVTLFKLNEYVNKFENPDRQFIQTLQNKNLTADQVKTGLYRLTKILYEFFNGTKVIILVDEFDTTAILTTLTTKTYSSEANALINSMLTQAFTSARKYIKLVLLTGITTLSYSSDATKLENTPHYAFLDRHQFTPYYGFVESDLDRLFDKYKCDETEKNYVRKRYKGYSTMVDLSTIYNTFAVANHFMNEGNNSGAVLNTFKTRTPLGPMSSFLKNAEFRKLIDDLRTKGKFTHPISKIHTPDAINELRLLKERRFVATEPRHASTLLTFYFEMGFFNHHVAENYTYVIPNKEVEETIDQIVKVYDALNEGTTPSRV